MKKVTREFYVYDYEELGTKAREKACQDYYDGLLDIRIRDYEDDLKFGLEHAFPNSNLHYQYSLNYCQGDGLNVYGRLSLIDAFEHWESPFISGEKEKLLEYEKICGELFLPENETHYSYCYVNRLTLEDWKLELEDNEIEFDDILIDTLQKWLIQKFESLCLILEKKGYEELYYCDEDYFIETCQDYGWQFLIDGTLYTE